MKKWGHIGPEIDSTIDTIVDNFNDLLSIKQVSYAYMQKHQRGGIVYQP